MKRLLPLLFLLAACEGLPPPTTVAVAPAPVVPDPIDLARPPETLGRVSGTDPLTGIDRLALVNLVPLADGMRVYYLEAKTTPEAVAAAPGRICKAKGGEVASVTTREPETPNELPGTRILTVRCTAAPAPASVPATAPTGRPEQGSQR